MIELLFGERPFWKGQDHLRNGISHLARLGITQALAGQAQRLAAARVRRDFDLEDLPHDLDGGLSAEPRRDAIDLDFAVDVETLQVRRPGLHHPDVAEQVPGRATELPWHAATDCTENATGRGIRRHLNVETLGLFECSLPFARSAAPIDPRSLASDTSALPPAIRRRIPPVAVAFFTRYGRARFTGAPARRAGVFNFDLDGCLATTDRRVSVDRRLAADVLASYRWWSGLTASPLALVKRLAKEVFEISVVFVRPGPPGIPATGRAIAQVVSRALLRVAKDAVSPLDFLEFLLGLLLFQGRLAVLSVGMKFHREPPVGRSDLRLGRARRNAESVVVVDHHRLFRFTSLMVCGPGLCFGNRDGGLAQKDTTTDPSRRTHK
ncbi:hypothetical protein PO002_42775 [Cupriavidus necator]